MTADSTESAVKTNSRLTATLAVAVVEVGAVEVAAAGAATVVAVGEMACSCSIQKLAKEL